MFKYICGSKTVGKTTDTVPFTVTTDDGTAVGSVILTVARTDDNYEPESTYIDNGDKLIIST